MPRPRSRVRSLLVAFALFALPLQTARAQAATPLHGTWAGDFVSDAPFRATMRITIAGKGSALVLDNRVELNPDRVAEGPARAVRIEKDSVWFVSDIGGAEVSFAGLRRGDSLTGSATAMRNGQVVGSGTWSLARKAGAAPSDGDADSRERLAARREDQR